MCQFVLFRQVFFKQFILRFDPRDFSKEWKQIDFIELTDLIHIEKVMKGLGDELTLSQLEKLDEAVEILGLDFNRAIYFQNSRSLLSEAN